MALAISPARTTTPSQSVRVRPKRPQQVDITSRLARRKTVPVKLGVLTPLVGVLVVLVSLFCVWQRTQMIAAVQELDSLRQQAEQLTKDNAQLRLKIETSTGLERVEQWAAKQGFVVPEAQQVVRVRKG
ncbi:MAG: cell division protein FtsL [Nitrospirota bacterium]|jgi:cell division protein FtsL